MDYVIEELNLDNIEDFVRVNMLAWKESYKGIVNDDFLELINREEEIQKTVSVIKNNLNDGSKRYLLKYQNEYVGVLRVRETKYDKYKDCGELGAVYLLNKVKGKGLGKVLFNKAKEELKKMGCNKMIIGCLQGNPSNEFYKHMGGLLVDNNPFTLPNGQELTENLYYYDTI